MRYLEFAPAPTLAAAVQCLWTLDGAAAGEAAPVLPDGRPELILHLGAPFEIEDVTGTPARQSPIVFAGQLPRRLVMRPSGHVAVVGVRFHPFGAAALLRVPQVELLGPPISLDAIDGVLARGLARVRAMTSNTRLAVPLIQEAVAAALRPERIDPRVGAAVAGIERSGGRIDIARLARAGGMTTRHLERLFLRQVGIGPKRLARVARFQRALGLLERGAASGAATAADCGYADQAHFSRDFRALAGCAPSAHLIERAELTSFFVSRDGRGPRG